MHALPARTQDLFWHVQRSAPATPKQPLLRAGWLAFLLLKAQLLPGFPDLVRWGLRWLQRRDAAAGSSSSADATAGSSRQ